MFTNTVILTGTVVVEGVAFRWSVTDGVVQRLTVSHRRFGTRVEQLVGSPERQARTAGRGLLAGHISLPDVDAVDDFGAV